MNVEINYLAVLLAGLSSMVVGSIWYSMGVFGKTWSRLANVDMNRKMKPNEMVYLMGGTFVISLITAYVLAHFAYLTTNFFNNSFLSDSLGAGLLLWLGFTAMRFATHDLFEGRRKKLTLLNLGNELTTIMVMALIIGFMGV